jgi:hypothetical protein
MRIGFDRAPISKGDETRLGDVKTLGKVRAGAKIEVSAAE